MYYLYYQNKLSPFNMGKRETDDRFRFFLVETLDVNAHILENSYCKRFLEENE